MPQTVLIKRTSTPNSPPAANSLSPGELAVEMAVPTRLWVGVPPALDPTSQKLLFDSSAIGTPIDAYTKAESDALFVQVPGDTMTGPLIMQGASQSITFDATVGSQLDFNKSGVARWKFNHEISTETGTANAGGDLVLNSYADDGTLLATPLKLWRSAKAVIMRELYIDARLDGMANAVANFMAPTNGVCDIDFGSASGTWGYNIYSISTGFYFFSNDAKTAGMYLAPNGAAWVATSDARLPWKISATPYSGVLDRMANVQLYTNTVPASGKQEIFFKAQELATAFPEVVHQPVGAQTHDANYVPDKTADENAWGVMYDRTGAVALQAVKELLARVEALEAQLAAR